ELQRRETAPRTVGSYRQDLELFGRWLEQSNGEAFAAAAVTPTDLREYRSYLQTVEGRKPATINRKLAALRSFFAWARADKRIQDSPIADIKGVKGEPS